MLFFFCYLCLSYVTSVGLDHRPVGHEVPILPRRESTAEFQPLGENSEVEYFFASDASAIIEHTNRVIFLEVILIQFQFHFLSIKDWLTFLASSRGNVSFGLMVENNMIRFLKRFSRNNWALWCRTTMWRQWKMATWVFIAWNVLLTTLTLVKSPLLRWKFSKSWKVTNDLEFLKSFRILKRFFSLAFLNSCWSLL